MNENFAVIVDKISIEHKMAIEKNFFVFTNYDYALKNYLHQVEKYNENKDQNFSDTFEGKIVYVTYVIYLLKFLSNNKVEIITKTQI
jgi:hypothetical protein